MAAINKNGYIYTFNRNNLAAGPEWSQQIAFGGPCPQCGDGSVSSGAFANGTLYFAGGNTVINGQGYGGSVNALDPATGNYLWRHGVSGAVIAALSYSNGLIIDGAGNVLEVLNATSGARLYSYATGGTIYAAPSVSSGQVFTGGTDGNVYAFGLSGSPPPTPTPDPNCANSWSCQDIGNPAPAGSETISGVNWSVQAGGSGIGNTSDQFRLISQNVSGNTQISAQVVSQQASSGSAQAGLMARQTSDPTSPYYAVFLTKGNGLIVQDRLAFGGPTASVVQVTTASSPLYLEIQRIGDQFTAATSTDGINYTQVLGSTVIILMPTTFLSGLAASSDNNGNPETVTFTAAAIGPPNPLPANPCPTGWSCVDIGTPALAGGQSHNGAIWVVQGGGNDIWGNSDQFHFVSQSLAADGSVSARVISQTNTDGWAKAGVMLRQSTDPGSPFYDIVVSPGNGIVVQYRATQGAGAQQLAALAGTVPAYLMVARSGNTYTAYTSTDGTTWNLVAGSSITLSGMSGPISAGLAVTSHNGGALSTVTFDTVSVSTTVPPPPPVVCPTGWSCADIGTPALAGGQSLSGSTWTIQGGGNDIWGNSDQFHFVSQSLAADGSVSARVISQTNTDGWAKAGVMLRQSTDPGSPYYFAFVTPGNGINVQYRAAQGAASAQLIAFTGTVPAYLMVARSGNTYTAYTSTDGTTWNLVAGSSITLNMSGPLLAGLAVTSHNGGALSTVTFDTVSTPASPPSCPTGWSCVDIGTPALAGGQSLSGSTWTIQGGGNDIWGNSDQFHFVSQSLAADGSVSARVISQTNTDGWAKAGVMLRQSTNPGSPYYFAFVTPGNGINVQYRAAQGAASAQLIAFTGTVPAYLMVARSGNTYTAYTSTDGTTWNLVAGSSITLSGMSGPISAGLAVTSHNGGALSTVTFDTVSVSTTVPPPPPVVCPTGWSCADIGTPALAGGQSLSGSTWTIQGGGNDIWGNSDQFHFVSQSLAADGSVSARVISQTNTDGWAKAGVMLRQSTNPGSPYYFAFVTPGNGINVQYRAAQGAASAQLIAFTGTVPAYLMVARSGNTYTAYTSTDGTTWNLVAGSSITLNMSGPLLAGLAVTSHNGGALSTVTFDTVSVSTTVP